MDFLYVQLDFTIYLFFYFTALSLNTNHILIILYPLFEIFNMEKTIEEEYVCTL